MQHIQQTFAGLLVILGAPWICTVLAEEGGLPRTFYMQQDYMEIARQAWEAGDPYVATDIDILRRQCENFLPLERFSVLDTELLAPSGDPHDYVGGPPLYWPNPDTPDGLPWVFRDGEYNHDAVGDFDSLTEFARVTEALSLGYYFFGDERYANKAASLLRAWFLDEETRMNPSMDYSLLLPGHGAFYNAVAVAMRFPELVDAAGILEASPAWSAEDKAALQQWMRDFIDWVKTSELGQRELVSRANHGTSYEVGLTAMALYAEDLATARDSITRFVDERLGLEIAPDGSQPFEMGRSNNHYYHRFGLDMMMELAALSRTLGEIDVFNYTTEDGRSLRSAVDFLRPYSSGDVDWDHYAGTIYDRQVIQDYAMLRKAAAYYASPEILADAQKNPHTRAVWINLTHPAQLIEVTGDFDFDSYVTVEDLNLLTEAIQSQTSLDDSDLNGDGQTNLGDREYWITEVYGTVPGDADMDRDFDSFDLDLLRELGKYGDDTEANSTWREGDFSGDGDFDAGDLVAAFAFGAYRSYTLCGDANHDGEFNSTDFVQVFEAGKYETQEYAGWSEGDWNGDRVFDTDDFVAAFIEGGYETGPMTDVSVVPEAGSWILLLTGLSLSLFGGWMRV